MPKDVAADLDAIGSIYDAALDSTRWSEALARIATRLGATRALLHDAYLSRSDALLAAYNLPSMALDLYRDRFWRSDPWTTAARSGEVAAGKVFRGDELVDAETRKGSECYREFMAPMDIRYLCGAVVQDQWRGLAPPTYLAFYRPSGRGDFGPRERALLNRLVPHVQAAVNLYWGRERRQGLNAVEIAVLDRLSVGVIVSSRHGRVLYANPTARAILRRNDGLTVERGRLASASLREGWRLNRMVSTAGLPGAAMPPSEGAVAITRANSHWPYLVQVVPLPGDVGMGAAVAVFITDPAPGAADLDAPEFDTASMTPAERRVLGELRMGLSRRQIAARLTLSPNTVHAHLKSIFAKTGATRQTDLARLGLLRALADGTERSGEKPGAKSRPSPRRRTDATKRAGRRPAI